MMLNTKKNSMFMQILKTCGITLISYYASFSKVYHILPRENS